MAKSTPKTTPKKPRLFVTFDTNVLYTEAAHHLLRLEAKELITSNSDHHDLTVEWFLADIVCNERHGSMTKCAAKR